VKNFLRLFLVSTCLLSPCTATAEVLNYEDYPIIKLRTLDKITAQAMTVEAKVGSTVRFGELFIKVQACRKPPPIEKIESAGFLQIWQTDGDNNTDLDQKIQNAQTEDESKWIFSGWMFASSPTLSALDHPIYDVWVLDCLGRDPEPLPPEEPIAEEPTAEEAVAEEPVTEEPATETPSTEETGVSDATTNSDTNAPKQEAKNEPAAVSEPEAAPQPEPTPEQTPEPASEPQDRFVEEKFEETPEDQIIEPTVPQQNTQEPALDENIEPSFEGVY
jgi:hypothetical protein